MHVAICIPSSVPGYKTLQLTRRIGTPLTRTEHFGIAIAKNNPEFLEICNKVIEEMKQDGSLKKSLKNHMRKTLFQKQ